jgi:hypothetical protein
MIAVSLGIAPKPALGLLGKRLLVAVEDIGQAA